MGFLCRNRQYLRRAQPNEPSTGAIRWIGSGRTIYNNKGKPVMQYEPYFSPTHACDTALQAESSGISPRMYYDPLDRLQRTELPDGTSSYTEWDGWKQTAYDPNDCVLQSDWHDARTGAGSLAGNAGETDADGKAVLHDNTPAVVHLDSLARPFYTIQHNRTPDGSVVWQDAFIHSYETLDITGNRLAVKDGRGLTPLTYKYNLVKAPEFQHSIDSGDGRMITDAAGQPMYHWDADGRKFQTIYDGLRRPLEQWCGNSLLQMSIYGEGMPNATALNLKGQVVKMYDGAGKHYTDAFDFKGQPLISNMRLLADATISDADWDSLSDGELLSDEVFFTEVITDALGRPKSMDSGRSFPGTAKTTEHNVTLHTYEKDGSLKTVVVNGDTYMQDIRHNAQGQREAIWYGNGTKTSYTYDPLSQRLKRILTVNLNTSPHPVLQDLNYFYDPTGNITSITDGAQQTIFFNNVQISPDADYTYDAIYRLIKAEGRESITPADFTNDNYNDSHASVQPPSVPHWDGSSNALRRYTQKFSYDPVGNILELKHIAGTGIGSYTRSYTYSTTSNRLISTQVGGATPFTYSHDTRGNMTAMPHLSLMGYDTLNQMHRLTAGTTDACYQYSGGERARKYLEKGSSVTEERIYMGSYEVYRRKTGGTVDVERATIHVADDSGRIAMIEKRVEGTDGSAALLKRFIYSNHLGSAALELDHTGAIISYEEYHPFGTTAYSASDSAINAVAKRYRYTGKERDEESGLNYHGARYYALWLCRWCAVDPLESKYAGLSPYNYCFNNPVNHTDPSGRGPDEKNKPIDISQFFQPVSIPKTSSSDVLTPASNPRKDPDFSRATVHNKPKSITAGRIEPSRRVPNRETRTGGEQRIVTNDEQRAMQQTAWEKNQPVQMADMFGNGHIGPKGLVEAQVKGIETRYWNQVADNIRGGPFGAYGAIMGGPEGSFRGAIADGVVTSLGGAGTFRGRTEPASPIREPFVARTTEPLTSNRVSEGTTFTLSEAQAGKVNPTYPSKSALKFAEKVSEQKMSRHLEGTAPSGKSYFNSINDAQSVLNAYNSGNYTLVSENVKQSTVVIRVPSVIGNYVNVGNPNGLPDIEVPTSVFMIQSLLSPKVVPVNPHK